MSREVRCGVLISTCTFQLLIFNNMTSNKECVVMLIKTSEVFRIL